MQVLRWKFLKKMPWKNGQGTTTELAIDPPGTQFPTGDFLWRVSCAEVQAANHFSLFPGYDRLLMVWQGPGLLLNGRKLEPFVPFPFSGEEAIQCDLIGGPVLDLGVIYRRGLQKPSMAVLTLKTQKSLSFEEGLHFLFCADGKIETEGQVLERGDALRIEKTAEIAVSALQESKLIVINLSNKK